VTPVLVAVHGPWKGTRFPLTDAEISIGRDQSNKIAIADPSISRKHCIIRVSNERCSIHDLNSRNGSFINGVPVRERELKHADQIEVGASVFVFAAQESQGHSDPESVQIEDRMLVTRTTLITPVEAARAASESGAILKLRSIIETVQTLCRSNGKSSERENERKLFSLIFGLVPAERGAMLLFGSQPDRPVNLYGWDSSSPGKPVQVSRSALDQVQRKGAGFYSNDALSAEGALTSIIAIPMVSSDHVTGVLYLDSTDPKHKFSDQHLETLTGVGSMAALAVENARAFEWLESENQRLRAEMAIEHNMVGESQPMRELYQMIARVAPAESTVMIRGESGTGKELVARAICRNSPRAGKPFVAINCAAIPDTLLESELFGHEKGAFTGAIAQKKGKLEVANTGTLFLDEVGELAPVLQAKILRFVQEREYERVGGTRPLQANVRVLAATNQNLEDAIAHNRFRADLFFRLNVVALHVPPLRERGDDVLLLASHFAAHVSRKMNRRVVGISSAARRVLLNYDWPGNVRELQNAIEHAVVLGSGDLIHPEDLPETVIEAEARAPAASTRYHEAVKETKKQLILKAVEQAGGNYTEAARLLGVHPNYLHRLIRNLNLRPSIDNSDSQKHS
jgi:transcriptional regulator with GAF, ATPase, and Fis domain/pSer/pThr/pTyr-binding forkhead associated (FHA) protein